MIDKYLLEDLSLRSDEKGELARWVIQLQADVDTERRTSASLESVIYARDTRIAELEAKLATPVRLPTKYSMLHREDFHSDYQSKMVFKADEVIAALHAHGLTVEGEDA
ncbi:TPA: hypothetical protein ACQVG4_001749 [Serratia marcescens]